MESSSEAENTVFSVLGDRPEAFEGGLDLWNQSQIRPEPCIVNKEDDQDNTTLNFFPFKKNVYFKIYLFACTGS